MKLEVDCYLGHKGDARRVWFRLDDEYLVEDVLDQWYGASDTYFKVRAHDGNLYIFSREASIPDGLWLLESFRYHHLAYQRDSRVPETLQRGTPLIACLMVTLRQQLETNSGPIIQGRSRSGRRWAQRNPRGWGGHCRGRIGRSVWRIEMFSPIFFYFTSLPSA